MAKVPADAFSDAVKKIVAEYGDDVTENVKEISRQFAKKGAQAVKSASKAFGGTGEYAAGWTSRFETGRLSAQGTIYNAKLPGLPHLLEHGHANRGGGRTPGRAHIAPVEERIVKEFEEAVISKL